MQDPVEKAAERYWRSIIALHVVTVTVLFVLLFVLLWNVLRLNDIADSAHEQRDILIECTTPGHDCYERGQKATAKAVHQIIKAVEEANS